MGSWSHHCLIRAKVAAQNRDQISHINAESVSDTNNLDSVDLNTLPGYSSEKLFQRPWEGKMYSAKANCPKKKKTTARTSRASNHLGQSSCPPPVVRSSQNFLRANVSPPLHRNRAAVKREPRVFLFFFCSPAGMCRQRGQSAGQPSSAATPMRHPSHWVVGGRWEDTMFWLYSHREATSHSARAAAFKFTNRSILLVHTTQNIQGVRLLNGNLECTYTAGWLLQLTLIWPSISFWMLMKHIFKVFSESGPLLPHLKCLLNRHLRQAIHCFTLGDQDGT